MREEERAELFASLIDLFMNAGLGWVVDEVQGLIAQGVEEQVDTLEWTGKGKPKKGDSRTTRRDYSNLERLDLLLESISRVIKDGTDVEIAVAKFFADEDERVESAPSVVRFRESTPDDGVAAGQGFDLGSPDELAVRQSAVTALLSQLDEVKAEAHQ